MAEDDQEVPGTQELDGFDDAPPAQHAGGARHAARELQRLRLSSDICDAPPSDQAQVETALSALLQMCPQLQDTQRQWRDDAEALQEGLVTGDAAAVYQQCYADSRLRAAIAKPFVAKQQQLKLHLAAKPRLQSKVTKMQEAVQADTFVAKFTMPTEMQQGLQAAGNDNATTMVLDGLKLAQQTLLDKHVAELECPLATTDWQQHPIQEMFDAAVASMPQVTHFAAAARDVCIRIAFPRYMQVVV
jgi:hypothetical protein